jgi:flagellar assembly protein FliH
LKVKARLFLQAKEMKSLWYKGLITTEKGIMPFPMPLLNEEIASRVVSAGELVLPQVVEHIEREAYEKGFESGENAGFAMGEEKALVLIGKVDALLHELETLREKTLRELEPQIIELSVAIARKILIKELDTSPDEIVAITKEAVMRLERAGQITIRINPSLYDLFMKHKPELLTLSPDIIFDVDPSASPYGSVVSGPSEDVVTDLDEQIRNIVRDMGDRGI